MFSYVAPESNPVFVFCFGVESAFRVLPRNRIWSLVPNRAIGMLRSSGNLHFSTPQTRSSRNRRSCYQNENFQIPSPLFEKEKKPGQTFSDWLKSKDDVELKRISLKEGGSPDRSFKPSDTDEFDILKRVNEIMLLRQTLSPRDNAVIDDLLERSLGGKK